MENELVLSLDKISESLQKLEKSTKSISQFTGQILKLSESCSQLSSATANMDSNSILSYLSSFNTVVAAAKNLSDLDEVVKELGGTLANVATIFLGTELAAKVATIATNVFSGALSFLTANPIVGVIAGLGLVVGALAIFGGSESDAEKETRLFIEAQEAKRNELVETSKAINESTAVSIENAKNAQVESEVLKGFVSNLKGLADENGYVKNFEEAQYYVDKINSAMPGTVKLTEDGKVTWLQNADAIDENIKQLERKAKVEAYYDGYVESLKNETKLRGELTLAQNNYNSELEKQQSYQEKYNELIEKYDKQGFLSTDDCDLLASYTTKMSESKDKLSEYSETLDKAKGAYEANAKGAELYNQAVGSLDGGIIASAQLQALEYTELEENGTSTWGSLAAASEDCKNRIATAQGDELAVVQGTSELIQAEMINKALTQGMTYDQMIEELEKSGVQMNETEKKQLEKSFNQWEMSSKDIQLAQAKGLDTLKLMKMASLSKMNEDDQAKLSENVKLFAEKGDASGIELCNKLAASLEANNGEVNEETKAIMADIEAQVKKANPTTQVNVDEPTEQNMKDVDETLKKVPDKKTTKVYAEADKKSFTLFGIKFPFFAEGGFPDTGELFVAREAGPELVGRINGKTAVANNDQIVTGISAGVFNAVRSAMQGQGKGNMNIHATFVMDGEVVGKQVIKYHNGVVRRTGTTPLMI